MRGRELSGHSIQKRLRRIEIRKEEVRKHPLCLRLEEDDTFYIVFYPPGDFDVDAIRANHRELGKSEALDRMLERMERSWMESYPAGTFF